MHILTIDIGGTTVKTGVLNHKGIILKRSFFPMPIQYQDLTSQMFKHIDQVYGSGFEGIAISSTGLVDPKTQEIGLGSKLYHGFGKQLVKHLKCRYQIPVSAENDGNCALLAEKWLGNGRGCSDFATIVLGTSVGGALMVNEQLVRGKHLLAGEIGYMLFPSEKKPWEIWSIVGSTRALVEEVSERKGKALDGYQVATLFEQGDDLTKEAVQVFIEKIAVACYTLQYMIDPEKILIGGGISKSSFLIAEINKEVDKIAATIPSTIMIPSVERCFFGNDSNLIGACYHFLFQQENQKNQ